jgi:phenylpyruvate tautomerase PptA (4-oxalocrotonate tautomerase family)
MPNIVLKIPSNSFPGAQRAALVQGINEAAATAERIPADPRKRFLCWVMIDEIEPGNWTCGGADVTGQFLPCMAVVHVPNGVLDDAARATYTRLLQVAFQNALPADEKRQLLTSVVFNAVEDGAWGVGGAVWRLPDFARAAGFAHLQHLVAAAPAAAQGV